MAKKSPEQTAWDVRLSAEKRKDFTEFLCRELDNAQTARPFALELVQYWWKLYEQDRTRSGDLAPWQDAADLTSYIATEKVDALKARVMRTINVDPIWTVEGWGESAKKAPFVEDFHQWSAESEGLQSYLGRVIHQSLVETRGVLEVFEDTTERVTRRTINAKVMVAPQDPMAPPDPMTGLPPAPSWVMDGDGMEPMLEKDEQGNYIEVTDAMTPSAQTVIDQVDRVRKGPGYRVISYENFLVLPGHAREKADIFGYAKRFTKRVDQLDEAVKAGTYDKQAVEEIHPSSDIASAQSPSGEAIPVSTQEGPTAEKELWEVQILHNLDGKGLRWYVATVHLQSRTLLRLKYDDINKGRFILFVPFPRTDRAHEGYSLVGHKLITVTEEHTAWRNMGADRAAMETSAPIKRLTTALWEPDLQPMGPKAVIDVRDMKEIEAMQIPPLTDAALRREQEAVQASERIAGMNDVVVTGSSTTGDATLGEFEERQQAVAIRMDEVIKNFQEALEDLGQIRNAIWLRSIQESAKYGGTYAPAHIFEGLDERGGDVCKDGKIDPSMLEGTFRFKPHGSSETADKAKQRGDYIQFLQGLPILFQTWPVLAQSVGQNPQAAKSAIEQMLRLFNIPDKQAWLGNIEQMMQPAQIDPMTGQPMGPPPMMGMAGMPPGMPGAPPGLPPQLQAMLGGAGKPPAPQGAK